MDDGRDAETGLLEEVALDLVGESGRVPGCQVAGARDPGDVPEALPEQWPGLFRENWPFSVNWKTQALPNWATFSSRVIISSRLSTRSSTEEAGIAVGRLLPVDGDRGHPFTPPVVSPVTICFWAMK